MYKEALKVGFYQLLAARDAYRDATAADGGMHVDLVMRFIRIQALLITPIAPHVAEHLWTGILGETTSIQSAQFPKSTGPINRVVLESGNYIRSTLKEIRDAELSFMKKKAKGKTSGGYDPAKPKGVKVYVSKGFPEWQEQAVAMVKDAFDEKAGAVDEAKLRSELAAKGLAKDKKYNPFIASFKVSFLDLVPSARSRYADVVAVLSLETSRDTGSQGCIRSCRVVRREASVGHCHALHQAPARHGHD